MIKVLIADDHPVVRRGLREIVDAQDDMTVVAEAGNAAETLTRAREGEWDVLILDISMPGVTGLDVLKQLRAEGSGRSVLILSVHPEDQYAVRALRAGADGYMTKEVAPARLVEGIRKVASGGKYVSSSLAERLVLNLAARTDRPLHEALSDREFEVLRLIASGSTTSEIAAELCLSPKTISTYRSRMLAKMMMRSDAQLTTYAMRHGLCQ